MGSNVLIQNNGKLVWFITIILNLFWLLLVFSTLEPKDLYTYFNSDTLYAPSIFRDIFIDGTGLGGWHLNAAPNFFPDLFFYSVTNYLIDDFRWAMFIYSIVQYVLLLVLLSLLIRKSTRGIDWWYLAIGNMAMLLFLFVSVYSGDFSFTFLMLSICYHLGPFLSSLLALVLLLEFFHKNSRHYYIWLMIVVFLASLSNRLFIVMFFIPALASLFILGTEKNIRKPMLKLAANLTLAMVAGILVFTLIKLSGYVNIAGTDWKMFNFANIGNAFNVWLHQHYQFIKPLDFRGVIIILSFLSFLVMAFKAIGIIKNLVFSKNPPPLNLATDFYILFFAGFFPVVLLMPILNGAYVGPAIIRFNIQSYYLAIFNLGVLIYLLAEHYNIHKVVKTATVLVCVLLIIPGFYGVLQNYNRLKALTDYYTDDIRCIDKFAREHNVRYGVAPYWYAKRITMFSKEGVRLYSIYENTRAYYHVMNENWYYTDRKGKHGNPEFRFVLYTPLTVDSAELKKQLGKPELEYNCPGNVVLKKYPGFVFDPSTRRPFIPGWSGAQTQSQIHSATNNYSLNWRQPIADYLIKDWIKAKIIENHQIMDSLKKLDSFQHDSSFVINQVLEKKIEEKGKNHFEKEMAVEIITREMESSPSMMEYLKQKADNNNITLREQISRDARWLFNSERNKQR